MLGIAFSYSQLSYASDYCENVLVNRIHTSCYVFCQKKYEDIRRGITFTR